MATYHASVKVGPKGKAGLHSEYIARMGKYTELRSNERLELVESGNLPAWAAHHPPVFWHASDQFERANGNAYREYELALPRELTPEQRGDLVRAFVKQELGERHAYTFAIHNPPAALEGGDQPHVHIMFSDRKRDGIERDPEQYFRRYNAKSPEKGGCQKEAGVEGGTLGARRVARKEQLVALRERWAELTNEHLAHQGHAARVDHRSLAEQGSERTPERHLGGRGVRELVRAGDVAVLLEQRKAEGELERAQAEVRSSVLDLSGDLAAARWDRDRRLALERPDVVAARAAFRADRAREKAQEAQRAEQARQVQLAREAFRQDRDAEKQRQQEAERAAKAKSNDKDRGMGR